jgi:transcriptional regulator with XRE-family HTH domain
MVDTEERTNEHAIRVGAVLRRVRTERGLSLRELAARSGLSSGFISLAERGVNSLSLTSLFTLAEALDVDAAELIGGTSTRPAPSYAVARRDGADAPKVMLGEREYRVLTGSLPGKSLEALRTTIHPTAQASPPTSHEGEEFCYVLSGELTFHFPLEGDSNGSETIVVAEGDSIHFLSTAAHAIHNATGFPVEVLWVVDHPLLAHSDFVTRAG